jgi:hypothetical protein
MRHLRTTLTWLIDFRFPEGAAVGRANILVSTPRELRGTHA